MQTQVGLVDDSTTGHPKIILTEPTGSSAEVLLYGGQVVSWKNDRREQLLFRSTKALTKPPKTIRGGIPICFPQFGNSGSLELQGFARNRLWVLDPCPSPLPPPKSQSSIDLILKSTEDDMRTWPHSFELRLRVVLAPDVSEIRVEGLETLDYLDNLMHGEMFTEQTDAITFDGEVDRVYLRTPNKIAVIDHEKKRTLVVRKGGLPDAALWSPWDKKAKVIPEFGDKDYKAMLCVDSAAVEAPIVLKPSEEWMGHQELSFVSSSYYSGQLDPRKVLLGY